MATYRISEKAKDMAGKWRVRVVIDEKDSMFLKFEEEPNDATVFATADLAIQQQIAQQAVQTAVIKSSFLMKAENDYVLFCRSLGLVDKASTSDLETLAVQMQSNGQVLEAIMLSIKALALINNITQNGGNWDGIEWHDGI